MSDDESPYPKAKCRHCKKAIYLIPFGDGLWVHGTDPIERTALCNDVSKGVLLTANPTKKSRKGLWFDLA